MWLVGVGKLFKRRFEILTLGDLLGKTEKVSASNVKLKVNVDGVSNSDCQKVYSSENRQIIDTQVCAGGKKGFDSW